MRGGFFRILFVILVIITILQVGGTYLGGFDRVAGLDKVVHFLGGLWIGGMALWFLRNKKEFLSRIVAVIAVSFGAALIVGLGWELYEFAVFKTLAVFPVDYVRDTITDLVADSAGGCVAVFLFLWFWKKN